MNTPQIFLFLFFFVAPLLSAETIREGTSFKQLEFVLINDPNNLADSDTGFGSVNKLFQLGKYKITAKQYEVFLNSVAFNDDRYGLFDSRMESDPKVACMRRSTNEQGCFHYEVIKGREDLPITYVDLFCALRFCNWLQNGSPSGDQGSETTETGAYVIHQEENQQWVEEVSKSSFFIASEDQWYKAAYYHHATGKIISYDPDAPFPSAQNQPSFLYWNYPTQSMEAPCNSITEATSWGWETVSVANYFDPTISWYWGPHYTTEEWSYWNRTYNHQGSYLTPVGSFTNSMGPYGTFDMGGDVNEWIFSQEKEDVEQLSYLVRGGSWESTAIDLHRVTRHFLPATTRNNTTGFRVARRFIPERKEKNEFIKKEDTLLASAIDCNTAAAWSQLEGVYSLSLFSFDFVAQEAFEMALIYDAKEGFRLRQYLFTMIPTGIATTIADGLLFGFQNATEWGAQWAMHMISDALGLAAIDYLGTQEAKELALRWRLKPMVDFYESLHEACHQILDPTKKNLNNTLEPLIGKRPFSEGCSDHNHGPTPHEHTSGCSHSDPLRISQGPDAGWASKRK